jgi:spore coat-associated protein N
MTIWISGFKSIGMITAKIAIATAAAVGSVALVSSSVLATLTATASNTSGGSVTSGTLSLTQAASTTSGITGGFSTAITGLAPGDRVNRYVVLTNDGTVDGSSMTLGAVGTGSNTLTTDGTKGLQATVNQCSVAWSASGTCSETQTVVMASTSLLSLATPATLTLQANSLLSGAVIHLQIGISLPTISEVTVNGVAPVGTIQGLSTALTWTFTQTQRTGQTFNS